MENLTFDQLPQAVTYICSELEEMKRLLITISTTPQVEADRWMDLNELVTYDPEKRSKPTLYGYIRRGDIPFHKKRKKIIFLKSEIDEWIKNGRQKSNSETSQEAEQYLTNKKGLNNGK